MMMRRQRGGRVEAVGLMTEATIRSATREGQNVVRAAGTAERMKFVIEHGLTTLRFTGFGPQRTYE
jgi:hypothetical protein